MRGERALDFSLETISNAIDTRGEGFPVVVYNPLFWERTEPAIVDIVIPPDAKTAKPWAGTVRMTDGEGKDIPVQVLEKRAQGDAMSFRVVFMAEGVPSLGYRLYRLIPAENGWSGPEGVKAGTNELENDFLKVRLDPKTGWIESLYDKTAKREVLAGPGNVLEAITDEPKEMSAWELGLKGIAGRAGENGAILELVEKGPVRVVLRVKSRFRDSTFEQDLTLYAGSAAARLPDAPRLARAEHHDQGRLPAGPQVAGRPVRDPLRLDLPSRRRDGGSGPALDRCL